MVVLENKIGHELNNPLERYAAHALGEQAIANVLVAVLAPHPPPCTPCPAAPCRAVTIPRHQTRRARLQGLPSHLGPPTTSSTAPPLTTSPTAAAESKWATLSSAWSPTPYPPTQLGRGPQRQRPLHHRPLAHHTRRPGHVGCLVLRDLRLLDRRLLRHHLLGHHRRRHRLTRFDIIGLVLRSLPDQEDADTASLLWAVWNYHCR